MGSTRADSAAVRDLSERLLTLELGSDISLAGLTGDFRRLFRLQGFVSYSLRIEHTRIEVDGGAVSAGVPDRWVAELDSVVRASGARFGYYDALRPQSWQRNRARTRTELDARVPMPTNLALAYARVGLADLDQLRVLVCEGDTLLAWVGGFREERFTAQDKRLLTRLTPALHRRLVVQRHVATARLTEAALQASLDAVPCAAFVLDKTGRILCANHVGKELLGKNFAGTVASLRHCVRHRQRTTVLEAGNFALTELRAPGLARHYLALRQLDPSDPSGRLVKARQRWSLTPRQAQVLEQLVKGKSNRAISVAVGCAEGTVQLHVAALLAKAGAESRAEVVARFWTELG